MKVIADIPDVLYQQLETFAQREQIPIDGFSGDRVVVSACDLVN